MSCAWSLWYWLSGHQGPDCLPQPKLRVLFQIFKMILFPLLNYLLYQSYFLIETGEKLDGSLPGFKPLYGKVQCTIAYVIIWLFYW